MQKRDMHRDQQGQVRTMHYEHLTLQYNAACSHGNVYAWKVGLAFFATQAETQSNADKILHVLDHDSSGVRLRSCSLFTNGLKGAKRTPGV